MHHQIVLAELRRQRIQLVIMPFQDGGVGECDFNTRTVRASWDLSVAELQSTIMHEIAHIVLDIFPTDDPVRDAEIEDRCNEWAAEKLIPDAMLADALETARDEREVAERLGVDENVLAAKLRMKPQERVVSVWGVKAVV